MGSSIPDIRGFGRKAGCLLAAKVLGMIFVCRVIPKVSYLLIAYYCTDTVSYVVFLLGITCYGALNTNIPVYGHVIPSPHNMPYSTHVITASFLFRIS